MEEKVMKIIPPEGYEFDKEKSSFENIVFKKIEEKSWRNSKNAYSNKISGYVILSNNSEIFPYEGHHIPEHNNVFATKKQAKSALAMAQISQIMANDPRFGGAFTYMEWAKENIEKHVLFRCSNRIVRDSSYNRYSFLAFHTLEQRDLFLKENEDLVKDYLMID